VLTQFARSLFVAVVLVIGLSSTGRADEDGTPPRHAPEIDAGSATAALAMLAGGVLMIRARRR
jgi:hypothetical protein